MHFADTLLCCPTCSSSWHLSHRMLGPNLAEQNRSAMIFEPLDPYAVMRRISVQTGQECCQLSSLFTPSESMKSKKEVGGRTKL